MAQIVLVTGATDGIGCETALALARAGHVVLVHGRNEQKVFSVVKAAKQAGAPRADGYVADFARLSEVRRMADEVLRREKRLDVLLNNAGVYKGTREVTTDGHEVTFQVNHLAPFLLTNLLLPLLAQSAPARVVNVSSVAHHRAQLDFGDLEWAQGFTGYGAYALSKLANVLFTFELAGRVKDEGITANCLHPGVIDTKLLRAGFGPGGEGVEEGARTSVYLATSPEVAEVTGRYYVRCQPSPTAPIADDPVARLRLWEYSARATGIG